MTRTVDDAGAVEPVVAEAPAEMLLPATHLLRRSVASALLWLALPVLGEQFLNLFVGLTDTYLAGTVSKEATTAIGLATQVGWLVGLLFAFIGTGATALVSRHAGMGSQSGANHFTNQSIVAAVGMGLIGSILVWSVAPVLPRILGWSEEPASIAVEYLRIDAFGYILFSITTIGAACWRGMGDTRTPLYVMGVVNLVNVAVSAALRFGWGPFPEFGVTGIVIGTVTARTLGGMIVLMLLLRGRSGLKLLAPELRLRAESMRRLLWVGIPAGCDGILLWTGQFFFLLIISRLATGGEQAAMLAAHFVGIRVEALSYLPAFAWATAASTLVGQSLGARNPARASHSGHLAALQGAAMCLVMGIGYFIFAPQIYAAFNANEDLERVSRIGIPALRLLAFFQIPLALMIIYTNALRGAGDTRWPLLYTTIGMGLVRLPLAWVLGTGVLREPVAAATGIMLPDGLLGAWVGMCGDMTTRALLSGLRFARGRWQRIQV